MTTGMAGGSFTRRNFLKTGAAALAAAGMGGRARAADATRPNILWIVAEDINPNLCCYGDPDAVTPNLDAFAAQALRYDLCWSNAPVCAPARTCIITGMYPPSIGAEHMRSQVRLPADVRLFPTILREAGYYCTNCAKEDYNLEKTGPVWDESSRQAHWRNRPADRPFFAVFNIELTHESQIRNKTAPPKHDPAKMHLPAFHPDDPDVRLGWAHYHDNISAMDAVFAQRLKEMEDAGLADDTIVFFYGDNGAGMPGHKRWPKDTGNRVPLIVRVPKKYRALAPADYAPGGATARPVGFVDLGPTVLSLAGVKPPEVMQGRAFLGAHAAAPGTYVFGFRGRMDERYDFVRTARDAKWLYVRNYLPHLPYGQHVAYQFETPATRAWKKLHDEGKLNAAQDAFWKTKPPEELYELAGDPDQVRNLAAAPEHRETLERMRAALRDWERGIRDTGFLPEPEIHSRAEGSTPMQMARDDAKYPFEKIRSAAELASGLDPAAVQELLKMLGDADSAVRYWAALGLLMRGKDAVRGAAAALRKALDDAAPSVRIVAAQALGTHGAESDTAAALDRLKVLATPAGNGLYVSMMALNAIDALGAKADGLRETVKALAIPPESKGHRAAHGVLKLQEAITGEQTAWRGNAGKKKTAKKGGV